MLWPLQCFNWSLTGPRPLLPLALLSMQAAANAAAVGEWGIMPPGSLPTPTVVAAAAGAKPLSPLLLAAAKYAVSGAYSHWMDEQAEVVTASSSVMAADGTSTAGVASVAGVAGVASAGDFSVDAYLCECAVHAVLLCACCAVLCMICMMCGAGVVAGPGFLQAFTRGASPFPFALCRRRQPG